MKKEELKKQYQKELERLMERESSLIRVEGRLIAERGHGFVHPFYKKRFSVISNRIKWLKTRLDEM